MRWTLTVRSAGEWSERVQPPGSAEPPAADGGDLLVDRFIGHVARSLLEDMPALADEMTRRIVAYQRVYALPAALQIDDVRADVEENLGHMLRALAGMEPLDFGLTRAFARRRAEQGVPVAALLHAYRVSAEVIWDHHLAAGHRLGLDQFGLDEILDGAAKLWALTNTCCAVISQAYDDTSTERARRAERERLLVLDALFDGRVQDLRPMVDVARLLDLPERDRLVAVVAELSPSSPGTEALTRVDSALRMAGFRSAWRVRDRRQVGVVVVGTRPGSLGGVRAVLAGRATSRVGVSPVYADLADTRRHVSLAELALRSLPPGAAGTALFEEHLVDALVARSPDLAERVAAGVLGPVLGLAPGERALLLATLEAWVAAGGSAGTTAERLFCHRNTVRNRLQRVEELTGRSLAEPASVTDVCVALTALRLGPARLAEATGASDTAPAGH
ncbi:MAG: helix-turn-helix domain-containing protein [Actinobacteria bacterium]|nr:helix-turn-helix domain-containing protein [Actinomycetota bacterium]